MLISDSALPAFTVFHVTISLAAIISGFVMVFGMIANRRLDAWTAFFLATTVATSVTGFGFPIKGMTPGIAFGIISLIVLAAAIFARYPQRLSGIWRLVFIVGAVFAFYLNFVVLIVQSFQKVPVLPRTDSESERATVASRSVGLDGGLPRTRDHGREAVSKSPGRLLMFELLPESAMRKAAKPVRSTEPCSSATAPAGTPKGLARSGPSLVKSIP